MPVPKEYTQLFVANDGGRSEDGLTRDAPDYARYEETLTRERHILDNCSDNMLIEGSGHWLAR